MAQTTKTKVKCPAIEVTWEGNVHQAVYFEREEYRIIAKLEKGKYIVTRYGWDEDPAVSESIVVSKKDTVRLMEDLKVDKPDDLILFFGKRFALKEPHKCFGKIKISLGRRGIPYEVK